MRPPLFRFVIALAIAAFFYVALSLALAEIAQLYVELSAWPYWALGLNFLNLLLGGMLAYVLMRRWVWQSRAPLVARAARGLGLCLTLFLFHEALFFALLWAFNLAYPWLLMLSLNSTVALGFVLSRRYVFS